MTSATAPAQTEPSSAFDRGRRAFRNWRRSRPFWGALLVVFAGFPILYFPYNTLQVSGLSLRLSTTAGAAAAVIGLLLITLGVSAWFQPLIRIFAGIAAIILSLISFPTSNFGGFGLGIIPGVIGGALLCSWAPLKEQPQVAESAVAEAPEAVIPAQEAPAEEAPTLVKAAPEQQPEDAGVAEEGDSDAAGH